MHPKTASKQIKNLEELSTRSARRNQRWEFLNILGALTFVGFLWSFSYPGFHPAVIFLTLFGGVLGLAWIVMAARSPRRNDKPWKVATGPALAVALLALILLSAPLRIRFAVSSSAFDDQVADLEPAGSHQDWERLENVPDRIGTYGIGSGYQVGDGVIFYENIGAFFNHAGFAYLPDGPSKALENGSFEAPSFRHLTGDWYSWTASW